MMPISIDYREFWFEIAHTASLEEAFQVYESYVMKLGYTGVLYAFLPNIMRIRDTGAKPAYFASKGYSPEFLAHYIDAKFHLQDFTLNQIASGRKEAIGWWESKLEMEEHELKILNVARGYGLHQGVVLPLMSDSKGIAGASVVSTEKNTTHYQLLTKESLKNLSYITETFHKHVMSADEHYAPFIVPIIERLTLSQQKVLKASLECVEKLNNKFSIKQVALDLGCNEKSCEKSWERIRERLDINSTQAVLYHAGILQMLKGFEYLDKQR